MQWTPELGILLRRARKEKGWTQRDLKRKARLGIPAICAYENGLRKRMSKRVVEKFVKAFGGAPWNTVISTGASISPEDSIQDSKRYCIDLAKSHSERVRRIMERRELLIEKLKEQHYQILDLVLSRLEKMSFRDFESNFLQELLIGMGYQDVAITRASRDGGIDAICMDKSGTPTKIHVSAKHWTKPVGRPVVQQIRGTMSDACLVICLRASREAQDEAERIFPYLPPVKIIHGRLLALRCIEAGLVRGLKQIIHNHKLVVFD